MDDLSALDDQVSRILRSQTFARKGQLKKLLQILFANINSQDKLNPDFVIRELWPNETRTKRSTDVATEINRLRNALDTYYQDEANGDPVTISLPNRSAMGSNGAHDKSWIVAEPRTAESRAVLTRKRIRKSVWIAAVVALCSGAAVLAFVSIQRLAVPAQPRSGRLDATTLRIMDAQGKELWSKSFPDGFGPDWYYAQPQSRIWFGDVEGNGHTSVLFAYSRAGPLAHSTTLICYSNRGEEKWRWTPGRELPEMGGSPATYLTLDVKILKATNKRSPRIVVSSEYSPWWPNQVALLDSNGKPISEYWHSGTFMSMALADLGGDGREEIVATGIANGYDHQATLVVLDPDRVFGASTEVNPKLQIHGMGAAQEKLRLLFPRSDLNRALFQYNVATEPAFERGSLRLTVKECITPPPSDGCPIWYEFDKNFHLIAAFAGGDEFRSEHNKFFQAGKNPHTLSAEEQAAFLKVRCLVGCKTEFVPVGKLVP